MEIKELKPIIEALIFASDHPITFDRLVSVLEAEDRGIVREALNELMSGYEEASGGLVIDRVAGGYRLSTRTACAPWIKKLFKTAPPRISRAAMESLSIIAYKQPVTRGELEGIRGVDSGGVLKKLMDRRLIKITGRKETPGRPVVYGTTREFLEAFDLKDLSHLPTLKDIELPETDEDLLEGDATIVTINDDTGVEQLELDTGPNEETTDTETGGETAPRSLLEAEEAEPDGEGEAETDTETVADGDLSEPPEDVEGDDNGNVALGGGEAYPASSPTDETEEEAETREATASGDSGGEGDSGDGGGDGGETKDNITEDKEIDKKDGSDSTSEDNSGRGNNVEA